MPASGKGPTERARQWAEEYLENVVGAELHKHDMCGWSSAGLANKQLKDEYGGWEWRTLSTAVRQLWPSVEKKWGQGRKTDYLKDVRLKSSRYRYPYCLLCVLLSLTSVGFFVLSSPHQARRRRRRRKSKILHPQQDLRRRRRRESKLVL